MSESPADYITRLKQERDRLDKLSDELHDRCLTLGKRYQEARNACKDLIQERDELKEHIEMLVDAINQGTKKFQYEEAPFLHDAMGKHFEFETGLKLDDILGD